MGFYFVLLVDGRQFAAAGEQRRDHHDVLLGFVYFLYFLDRSLKPWIYRYSFLTITAAIETTPPVNIIVLSLSIHIYIYMHLYLSLATHISISLSLYIYMYIMNTYHT